MLQAFKKTFPIARMVLDCTEIHIQTASSKVPGTYSRYKGTTPLRSFIGFTPFGLICLVRNPYTGCISYKETTQESGVLRLLEPGDKVIADKGFIIKDLLTNINVKLVMPITFGPGRQFSQGEITYSQDDACLRIHAERAIRRIKEV